LGAIEAMRHSTEIRLPRTLDAARRARRFTNEACTSWRVPRLAQDAAIIATELVENTLRHTLAAPRLRLELHRDELTITVTDDDPNDVVLRESGCPPGFGLLLVAQTSRQWGCERAPSGGKTVWATLR
jgi:anti-sigma regulatory factor (Ser/Thr protein kinase)